jgi:tetratricopeptide (TPR) repeat protein
MYALEVTKLIVVLEQAKDLQADEASPQLINNIGVLQHTKGDLPAAQLMYQSAWAGTVKLGQEDGVEETEDMLITLSYNLGRLEEDAGNVDEAKKTYEGLLKNHPDYVDGMPPKFKVNNSRRTTLLSRCNRNFIRPLLQTHQRPPPN